MVKLTAKQKTQKETLKLVILNADSELNNNIIRLFCGFIDDSNSTKHLELAIDNFTLRLKRQKIAVEKKGYIDWLLETLIKCLRAIFATIK